MTWRRITDEGVDLIRFYEGVHDGDKSTPQLEPELDPVGIPTLGYGAIWDKNGDRVTLDTPAVTEDEAAELLARDVGRAERAVVRLITQDLRDGEFNALVSFTYNLGSGSLQASTLRQVINRGEFHEAPRQLKRWVFAGGRKLPGLVARRNAEAEMFVS